MEKPYWRQLEELVADIQRDLAPGAEVLHNVKLKGRLSGVDRQIDVLVRQSIGQYEMKIAIDCKDHASAVDVKGVEEFFGLVNDVGAHQGAMVSPKGFTAAAKSRAQGYGMALYSPVDTGEQMAGQGKIACHLRLAIGFHILRDSMLCTDAISDAWRFLSVRNCLRSR